ncbi:hypothetical protein ACQ5SK_03910 [Bradyrhizobium japonicum]
MNALVAAAKYALANGHLFPNTPKGMTPKEANDENNKWFSNWRKYAEDNAEQIRQMQETVDQFHNAGQRYAALHFPLCPDQRSQHGREDRNLKALPKGLSDFAAIYRCWRCPWSSGPRSTLCQYPLARIHSAFT